MAGGAGRDIPVKNGVIEGSKTPELLCLKTVLGKGLSNKGTQGFWKHLGLTNEMEKKSLIQSLFSYGSLGDTFSLADKASHPHLSPEYLSS